MTPLSYLAVDRLVGLGGSTGTTDFYSTWSSILQASSHGSVRVSESRKRGQAHDKPLLVSHLLTSPGNVSHEAKTKFKW